MLSINGKKVVFSETFLLRMDDFINIKEEQFGINLHVSCFTKNSTSDDVQVLDTGDQLQIGVQMPSEGITTIGDVMDHPSHTFTLRVGVKSLGTGLLVHLELFGIERSKKNIR